jgi:hypothetical protein
MLLEAVYSSVSGTKGSVTEQRLMDFLPGYRLLHIDELAASLRELAQLGVRPQLFPILGNYSSDYICVLANPSEEICSVFHDSPEIVVMHKTADLFLETICEFYRRGVYFLDADGFLDYDPEAHGICGALLNPGVEYWLD